MTATLAMAVVGAAALVAGCTLPAGPSVAVRSQPPDRGIVEGARAAPSAGCDPSARESSAVVGVPAPGGTGVVRITWQGRTRQAVVRVPADTTGPMPLLVSLHPFTLGPEAWEAYSGLGRAAAQRGYVAVTPLGSDPGPRWAVPGGLPTELDDVGFVAALLDHIEDSLCVDRNREFAAGFSAGAAMAQAVSCTLPLRFRAVAGSGGVNLTSLCPASPPTDVFVLHGTADAIAPLTGSTVVFAPPLGLPVADVVANDAARAGCDPVPAAGSPVAGVRSATYAGCADGHRVQYWQMQGAGHSWAGTTGLLSLIVGPTLQSFSATATVLDFFDATA